MGGRRVGTLSLGILLIVTGLVYLLGNLYNLEVSLQILKWWPITLIMIGSEILIYNQAALKENSKVVFDGKSLFLILLILLFSFSACIFDKIGGNLLYHIYPIISSLIIQSSSF